jgi:hypothetical protein
MAMALDVGPCSDWVPYWTCDNVLTASPALTGYAVNAATRVLWALSGRRYGTCQATLRPCRRECYTDFPLGWSQWDRTSQGNFVWSDYRYWFPLGCGSCEGDCSCTRISETILPTPVNTVVQVKVDGTPLVTGAYRVDNNRLLVRTDGQVWPRCNDLNKDDTQAGTWSVTATYGEDVPQSARFAVGELACEIIKAATGTDCRLPPGITSLARQGVNISIPDFGDLLKDGRTGLYLVDMFLVTENPHRLQQRGRVFSVDHPSVRRTGT